jgi:predicted RNase H-like HicB family nuclease
MTFQVEIIEDQEGFAASVASLPGCVSQGDTLKEAVENITIAIREYLEAQNGND